MQNALLPATDRVFSSRLVGEGEKRSRRRALLFLNKVSVLYTLRKGFNFSVVLFMQSL